MSGCWTIGSEYFSQSNLRTVFALSFTRFSFKFITTMSALCSNNDFTALLLQGEAQFCRGYSRRVAFEQTRHVLVIRHVSVECNNYCLKHYLYHDRVNIAQFRVFHTTPRDSVEPSHSCPGPDCEVDVEGARDMVAR